MSDLLASTKLELLQDGGGAPDMVHLLPLGQIKARDGRIFILDDPQAVIDRTKARGIDLPIDYEHQNDDPANRANGPIPAAGWITELVAKPDGIWGRVKWTDRAAAMVTAREYRFLSPSMVIEAATQRIHRIKGAGLVHDPALHLTALAQEQKADASPGLELVAKALGLFADADVSTMLQAIARFETPDPAKYVPLSMVTELLADRNTKTAALHEVQTAKTIDHAVTVGHITPAMRPWATALCANDPEAFAAFISNTEPTFDHLVEPINFPTTPPKAKAARGDLSDEICRQLGLAPGRIDT